MQSLAKQCKCTYPPNKMPMRVGGNRQPERAEPAGEWISLNDNGAESTQIARKLSDIG
jgi:hypothetical protein